MTASQPSHHRLFFRLGAIIAGLAVAFGAFGAHGLRQIVPPERLATWDTAASYQMYHGLGLLAVGWLAERGGSRRVVLAGWLMIAGVVLFSGSLYALVLTSQGAFGAITPLGGLAWLVAWLLLALA